MAFSGLQKTRQGLISIARSLYGSFAGKPQEVLVDPDYETFSVRAEMTSTGQSVMVGQIQTVSCSGLITSHGTGVQAIINDQGASLKGYK